MLRAGLTQGTAFKKRTASETHTVAPIAAGTVLPPIDLQLACGSPAYEEHQPEIESGG